MWKNAFIGVKLAIGFGLVVVVLATLGLFGVVMFNSLDRNVEKLNDRGLVAAKHSLDLQRAGLDAIITQTQYLVDENYEGADAARQKLAAASTAVVDIERVSEKLHDDELLRKARELQTALAAYARSFDEAAATLRAHRTGLRGASKDLNAPTEQDERRIRTALMKELHANADTVLAVCHSIEGDAWKEIDQAISGVSEVVARAKMILAAALICGILLASAAAWTITSNVVQPIAKTLAVLKSVAGGDYSSRVDIQGKDEIGQMAMALNTTIQAVGQAMHDLKESADQFTEGSHVIAESASTLAVGAQQQSASVEEISAAIEELSQSIEAVKENSTEADAMARKASQLAERGGAAVGKSIASMNLIKTSSTQISEIIQVISEIASQTNLLALNAAIEAARAGEHGTGFAVVADEVRRLAERSNQAAGKISALIRESSKRVEEGAALSEETGRSFREILSGVEATARKIGEIAGVAVEQAATARNVSNSIRCIAEVTEQAAAGSEEMAASSEQLGAQAAALRDLVHRFKTASLVLSNRE
jgi:methyl-accepting chemotaxis protein